MFILGEDFIFTEDKKEKNFNKFWDLRLMIKDRGKITYCWEAQLPSQS